MQTKNKKKAYSVGIVQKTSLRVNEPSFTPFENIALPKSGNLR